MEAYCDVRFEDYYAQVQCPVLFLPSVEEWQDARICRSIKGFAGMLNRSEIKLVDGAVHAYVWMQLPSAASEAVRSFLSRCP